MQVDVLGCPAAGRSSQARIIRHQAHFYVPITKGEPSPPEPQSQKEYHHHEAVGSNSVSQASVWGQDADPQHPDPAPSQKQGQPNRVRSLRCGQRKPAASTPHSIRTFTHGFARLPQGMGGCEPVNPWLKLSSAGRVFIARKTIQQILFLRICSAQGTDPDCFENKEDITYAKGRK